eukprot:TRINITY_DN6542_c0_g1_i1.p1 TRINITY_DN6542_c0_g1~~TRINITY_DN6542_c0_g1_i1.p1  ORF type:complete len:391 (-),score=99.90 TRINITY_DN6542_c0_g1_i1:183-1355(-)
MVLFFTCPFSSHSLEPFLNFPEKYVQDIMSEVLPRLIQLSMDINASHSVRVLIEKTSDKNVKEITEILLPRIVELSHHQFGRFVVEKIIERGSKEHVEEIFNKFVPRLVDISIDQNAHFVLQFMIAKADQNQLSKMMKILSPHFVDLSTHQYGSYIMDALFERANEEQFLSLLESHYPYLMDLCMHQYGHFAVQNIIRGANEEQLTTILKRLSPHLVELFTDNNGTFVAQKIMEQCSKPIHYETIAKGLKGKIASVSRENPFKGLVFRMLDHFPMKYYSFAIPEIVPNLPKGHLDKLSLETNVENAKEEELTEILKVLSPHCHLLANHLLGSVLLTKLLEKCTSLDHYEIISNGLDGKIVDLCKSQYGYTLYNYLLNFPLMGQEDKSATA